MIVKKDKILSTKDILIITIFLIFLIITNLIITSVLPSRWYCMNLPLPFILLLILSRGLKVGLIFSFLGGILIDIFSPLPFGTTSLSMVISVFTTGLFRNIIYRKTLYLYLLLILFMTLTYDLTIFFETIIIHQSHPSVFLFILLVIVHTLFHFLGLLIILKPFNRLIQL